MPWLRYDIFMSYSRKDGERVRPLVDELRQRGYRVFFDVESILIGERWKERLERSIRASRVLVLCWSEYARDSEYVRFEYSRAEGLRKPVLPWLLDETRLPAMIEIQGIKGDPTQTLAAMMPRLGLRIVHRRTWQTVAVMVFAATIALSWWVLHRPWTFRGEVYDRCTRMGIQGVEVVVDTEQGDEHNTRTDDKGNFILPLPQPQPKIVHVLLRKEGYKGDSVNVRTSEVFKTDMAKPEELCR